MIRRLITTPLLLAALAVGAVYYAYGEVDSCRVLALEEARRARIHLAACLWKAVSRAGTGSSTASNRAARARVISRVPGGSGFRAASKTHSTEHVH